MMSLYDAIEDQNWTRFAALLESGENPNQYNFMGEPLIIMVARTGNAQALKLMIDKGADVNAGNMNTALHEAVSEGHHEAATVLLEARAITNLNDKNGKTPLDIAKDKADGQMIDILQQYMP